jgi:Beta-lactamase enzyme family
MIDSSGSLYGWHAGRMFISGSVTKAMLMVQYLRTHASISADMREVLTSMIEVSDNDAADIVYAATGYDYGLNQVAKLAHMRNFVADRGFWGNSFINAADQARFFFNMDKLIPKRYRAFAHMVLSHIVSWESYGIPAVARPYWRVYFKGGWRTGLHGNRLIHQVARLAHGKTVWAVAIMTDGDPTDAYARATLEGVTKRLLGK